ncbi:protein-tyrosine phosphatase-like protein [Crucibulum laeve]|uniref:Protein-tyrosine phosphatase-like protein n=1 Tax=Crucibulum laeve TaxID=68775 RepID=A0A5C3M5M2_9AGAR|nr:protein-tyrosine phosphatase-like protein [Crucibulum laeve]
MLSFPAQNWQKAAVAVSRTKGTHPGSRFGRTASLIVPRVYLSDAYTATNDEELVRLGITHVISVIEYVLDIPKCIEDSNKLHIRLHDHPQADLLAHLDETTNFIQSALSENKTNKVLVHCFQGISRSATVVCAYLIATTDKTAPDSIAFVKAQRGIVCPNSGFQKQLGEYASKFIGNRAGRAATPLARLSVSIADRIKSLRGGTVPSTVVGT